MVLHRKILYACFMPLPTHLLCSMWALRQYLTSTHRFLIMHLCPSSCFYSSPTHSSCSTSKHPALRRNLFSHRNVTTFFVSLFFFRSNRSASCEEAAKLQSGRRNTNENGGLVEETFVPVTVPIHPVFPGTVLFLKEISRCPKNFLRGAKMSRFWVW